MSLAIALIYVALGRRGREAALPMLRHAPKLAVGGLLLALASGFFPLLLGEPPVSHRPARASTSSRSARWSCSPRCVLDIGVFLLVVGVLTVLLHQLARRTTEERS